jgi:SAM-dependent methyltransferase
MAIVTRDFYETTACWHWHKALLTEESARRQASNILENLQIRGLKTLGRVVELGCGSGNRLKGFADCGCEVVGVDLSPLALAEARRGLPGANYLHHDILDFSSDAYLTCLAEADLVLLLFGMIRHFQPTQLPELFAGIAGAMRPGSMLLVDSSLKRTGSPIHRPIQYYEVDDQQFSILSFDYGGFEFWLALDTPAGQLDVRALLAAPPGETPLEIGTLVMRRPSFEQVTEAMQAGIWQRLWCQHTRTTDSEGDIRVGWCDFDKTDPNHKHCTWIGVK